MLPFCKHILLFVCLSLLAGCFQYYYKTNTRQALALQDMQRFQNAEKYFIIHYTDSIVALSDVRADETRIEGQHVPIRREHLGYLNPDKGKKLQSQDPYQPARSNYRVKAKDRRNVFMQVHLYADQSMPRDQRAVSLPLSTFKRIDAYELDKTATTVNHVLSAACIALGAGSVALLVAAALNPCNCPQVYVKNDTEYQFISGVYSGAIYSSLERTDYLPLGQWQAKDNTYSIKIKNVQHEEQYINRMQLLRVQHPEGVRVLLDRHGRPLTYQKPQRPISVTVQGKPISAQLVAATDKYVYEFNGPAEDDLFSSIEMTFAKPANAQKAKLIVHAQNSPWSGYLYHSFAGLFGTGYEKWRNEKDKSSPNEMEQWQKDQSLPLMVFVERNGKWAPADYFAHTGNTASRDLIMELDMAGTESKTVKIKLATAYRFWDLNYAAIDFSPNATVTTTFINPSNAIKAGCENQVELITSVDDRYSLLAPHEELDIEYNMRPSEQSETYFFVATGYYHNMKKYEGKPQLATLMKFKNKGEFDRYSRHKYEEMEKMFAKLSLPPVQ